MKTVLITGASSGIGRLTAAHAILKAAEDRSAKLRYPVKGGLVFVLARVLPDAMSRPLLEGGMTRRPKKSSHRVEG